MKKDLEIMTKWLKDSGMKVHEAKAEMCVFHRKETSPVSLTLNQTIITSAPSINVLGILLTQN